MEPWHEIGRWAHVAALVVGAVLAGAMVGSGALLILAAAATK